MYISETIPLAQFMSAKPSHGDLADRLPQKQAAVQPPVLRFVNHAMLNSSVSMMLATSTEAASV